MSYAVINIGGKNTGPACKASFDSHLGCSSGGCIGCYGFKSMMRGKAVYQKAIEKEYNSEKFIKSCKKALAKGLSVIRHGKHSDSCPSVRSGVSYRVLQDATKTGIRFVSISKSIKPDKQLVKEFKAGSHVLHISLGMLSKISNESRIKVYNWYKRSGINVKARLTDDITSPINDMYKHLSPEEVILTPLRFASKEDAKLYNVNLSNYTFKKGYYYPKEMHKDWEKFHNICGFINDEVKCCSCLIGDCNE